MLRYCKKEAKPTKPDLSTNCKKASFKPPGVLGGRQRKNTMGDPLWELGAN